MSQTNIFRNDDVSVDSDVEQLREIRAIFEKHGLKETYSVTPFGRTTTLHDRPNANNIPNAEITELLGDEPIENNTEIVEFLKESLERGHHVCLHGHTHREMWKLPNGHELIMQGKHYLESLLDTKIEYYAAPFNSHGGVFGDMELLDGSGDMLESCVRNDTETVCEFCWYHSWRFYRDGLSPEKLDLYLDKYFKI